MKKEKQETAFSMFKPMVRGLFFFCLVWLVLTIILCKGCEYLSGLVNIPEFIAEALPDAEKKLRNLKKFVITPCFLLSFMVYLLYWVLCLYQQRLNSKSVKSIEDNEIICDKEMFSNWYAEDEHDAD